MIFMSGITRVRMGSQHLERLGVTEFIVQSRSNVIMIAPAGCGSDAQSGTYVERSGEIQLSANDTVYILLSGFFPYLWSGGKVKIERITVFYRTTNSNTDYITRALIESHDPTDGTYTTEWNDTDDVGKAETGRNSKVYNPNYVLEANKTQTFQIDAIVANRVYIYAVKFEWRMVASSVADGSVG